jgi:hypothetical protein
MLTSRFLALCGIHSFAWDHDDIAEFVDYVIAYEEGYFKSRGQTYVVLSRQEITLASGISGIELVVEIGPGGKSRRVYTLDANSVYLIDCETNLSDWLKLESTYDQIINSFTLDSTR